MYIGFTHKTIIVAIFLLGVSVSAQSPAESFTSGELELVADNLPNPWGFDFLPDKRIIMTGRKGRLMIIPSAGEGHFTEIFGLPEMQAPGQGGLLDVVVSPDYDSDRTVFISHSGMWPDKEFSTFVSRIVLSDTPVPYITSFETIFKGNNKAAGGYHFGSRLVFGPDKQLFVTIGDRRLRNSAQDINSHGGSVTSILNPFSPIAEIKFSIISKGHRNPQGAVWHPALNELWIHEHGPKGGDEINRIKNGANYGWPLVSYGTEYSGAAINGGLRSMPGVQEPLLYWTPSIAPSGIAVYTESRFKHLERSIIVGALAGKHLRRIEFAEDWITIVEQESLFDDLDKRIRDVRISSDGYIYFITDGDEGQLYRILSVH